MLSNKQVIEYINLAKNHPINEISSLVHSWQLDEDEIKQLSVNTKFLIKQVQQNNQVPLIMTVGGNYGVGKTTFCHEFGKMFDVPPRSGLGTVVKTLKFLKYDHPAVNAIDDDQSLENFDEKFDMQAKFLCEIINFIAASAQKSGSDYIIDGVQINPEYIDKKDVLLSITLATPDYKAHRERLRQPSTHFRRTPRDFNTQFLHLVEKYLLGKANRANSPIIINDSISQSVLTAGLMAYNKLSKIESND